MNEEQLNTLLHAFSDPNRRSLVRILAEAPLTVGEIAEVLHLPQPTISRYLKGFRTTGLLIDRRVGPRTILRLAEPAEGKESDLHDLLNHWIRRQPLPSAMQERLHSVLSRHDGDDDTFERIAGQWDDLRQRYFGSQLHLQILCSLVPRTWHILDAGTGTGYLLPALARQCEQVTAVDPSPAMLRLAQQRVLQQGLQNVQFRFGRLESLPLVSGTVDAALCLLVLHHSSHLDQAVTELARVLKDDGTLLIVDIEPHEMEVFQRELGDPVRGLDPQRILRKLGELPFSSVEHRQFELPRPGQSGGPEEQGPPLFMIKGIKKSTSPRPTERSLGENEEV